jgi:hypothetical protein
MKNVAKLKGNKLAAVLGTTDICQFFYLEAKNVKLKSNLSSFSRRFQNGVSFLCTICKSNIIVKKQKISTFVMFSDFYLTIPCGVVAF